MKVLYLQPAEGFGGAERQGVLHIRHLPDYGVDVVPVVGPGRPILRALESAGVKKYTYFPHFPAATHAKLSAGGNLRYLNDWATAIRKSADALADIAMAERPDLILANRTVGWLVAAPVSEMLGIPWIARAGSRPVSRLAPVGLLGLQLRWPPPQLLLANCEAVKRELAPWFRCPAVDLPNAVDTEKFRPMPHPDGLVIGMAARPAPEKGIDFLLDVVAEVTRRLPGAIFLWAGAFGWQPELEERARRAGLDHALRFLGHTDDVAGFYASCDVVVLTSRRRSIEGSPNALIEAMAVERPVVATAVGGVPEIVRSGVEGLLVEDGDVEGFAGALTTLLTDPALRRQMGAAGRRRVLERHAIEPVIAGLADVLRGTAEIVRWAA